MKKYLALLAAASVAFFACVEKPDPTPTPEPEPEPEPQEKAFSVTPESISVGADDTSATITVNAVDVKWSAKSDNNAFTVSPESGEGNATITVSFPANKVTQEVKAAITVSTYDSAVKTQKLVVNITQAAAAEPPAGPKMLAEWEFSADNAAFFNEHFTYEAAKGSDKKPTPESNAAGFLSDDHYCPSNITEGGKIRFWNGSDKTAINPDGRCKRGIGEKGEPCWYGNWVGDIAYINAATEPLQAGTKLHLWMALRPNTQNTLKYWLLEIKDGNDYAPVGEVSTVAISGSEVKYNVELIFNPEGSKDVGTDDSGNPVYPENPQQINTIIDREYILKANVTEVEYRLTCVSTMMADGSREATDIGDSSGKRANPVVRFAGKDTTNGGCRPVGENMRIEVLP
ncbi:MAG: BACON domain-containing protein [Bacteroidales bacterium]|jgi:hypothetical protein|nr:BACON domain-containing protein [Bacteroidales bacterium]